MKLFLEKISIGNGVKKFKVHTINDTLDAIESNYSDVNVFVTKSPIWLSTNKQTNNTLYDVDLVKMKYFSANNEDNTFKLPAIKHQDIAQFNDYDFSLSKEVSGKLSIPLDKFAFVDRYDDMNEVLISYDGTNFSSVSITPGMTDAEITKQLENVFGSANSTGVDKTFIGKSYTTLNPRITISQEAGSLPFSYILETDMTKMQNIEPYGTIEVNLFKTKNHLKNDYNVCIDEYDRLVSFRRYKSIGFNYDNMWLSYTVDHTDSSVNEYLTRNYETVENIAGMTKFKNTTNLHKSNIYSIRIFNSGLNAEGDIYAALRDVFEKAVFNLMSKIAPAHCQLWKIEFIDE